MKRAYRHTSGCGYMFSSLNHKVLCLPHPVQGHSPRRDGEHCTINQHQLH